MSRQLTDFATRQGDFWIRKCSEPVPFRGRLEGQSDFARQNSCPPLMRSELQVHETIKETETEPEEPESLRSMRSEAEEDDLVSRSICSAVADSHHSVAVADPTSLDAELIAVSAGFEQLTGYMREEAVGERLRCWNLLLFKAFEVFSLWFSLFFTQNHPKPRIKHSFWCRVQLPLPLRGLRATGRHGRGSAPGLRLWRALHIHRGEQAEDRRAPLKFEGF